MRIHYPNTMAKIQTINNRSTIDGFDIYGFSLFVRKKKRKENGDKVFALTYLLIPPNSDIQYGLKSICICACASSKRW